MSTTVLEPKPKAKAKTERRPLQPGLWTKEINVRHFIQQNYTPYYGDESFLSSPTKRTQNIWKKLTAMFVEERKKGVLDVSQIPSSITAHDAGYIDKKNEVIVGLQTDAPLKRAIMPNGGLKMVTNGLEAFGYKPDPQVVEIFTKYRKTHNQGVFDAYTADVRKCRS
jgi:formate C-acetyltransferase